MRPPAQTSPLLMAAFSPGRRRSRACPGSTLLVAQVGQARLAGACQGCDRRSRRAALTASRRPAPSPPSAMAGCGGWLLGLAAERQRAHADASLFDHDDGARAQRALNARKIGEEERNLALRIAIRS